jgi:hypothetical protein
MRAGLSTAERGLLAQLADDGWPLPILAPRDGEDRTRLRATALALLHRGLVEVYGGSKDATAVQPAEAEAILRNPGSWQPFAGPTTWFICASEKGNALLAADS